ncbi:MAG: tetratricopeptide repeat protein [Candidatus Binatia bacterium]
MPDTRERDRRELRVRIAAGVSVVVVKGWPALEAKEAFARARSLCGSVGELSDVSRSIFGLGAFHVNHGAHRTALALGEELLALAERSQDSGVRLVAHSLCGIASFWLAEFALARGHLDRGIALYDTVEHAPLRFLYGADRGVVCLTYAGWALWFLGYPDQALKTASEAIELARVLSHPFSLAYALSLGSWVRQLRREAEAARDLADAAISVSTEHGFPFLLWIATFRRGWALAMQGDETQGVAEIRDGLGSRRGAGGQIEMLRALCMLADIHVRAGRAEDGREVFARAVEMARDTDQRCYDPELRRLEGELVLSSALDDGAAAEACFREAVAIARSQSAKSLELRAATSLARLLEREGRVQEARSMLRNIYSWFTEGFDTADLKDAKRLLDELS